ncbi:MAG: GNAT family N-acetyltransferase [Candidatus Thorarchaeota archaeon]|nr:GNAT family N-acetyltransferase [Candidatus Thorarchaeota archaeon]
MDDLQLVTCNWDEINLDEVSQFIYDNRIGIYSNATGSEGVKRYLSNIQKRFPAEIIFTVRKGAELQAWAALDRDGETLAELGRWQPIVRKTDTADEIADMVFKGILDYSKKTGITRIECQFNSVSASNESEYEKSASWLIKNGFSKLEDDAYMTMPNDLSEVAPRRTPGNLSFDLLEGIDENALYECYYDSFVSGNDTQFLNLDETQRRTKFDKSFQSHSLNMDLSSVLKDEGKIVGFAFVHKRDDEEHIDRFGIREEYRGKGLAKAHLLHVVHEAKDQGTPLVSIGVDMSNSNAFKLYQNVGFEVESRSIAHVWKEK